MTDALHAFDDPDEEEDALTEATDYVRRAETGTIDVDPTHMMTLKFLTRREERDAKAKAKDAAERRKLIKWAIRIALPLAVSAAGLTGWQKIGAEETIEPVDVQETVEEAKTEASARDVEAAAARELLGKQTRKNHLDIEDLKIQSVESTDYIIDTLHAMSPKAATIPEPVAFEDARTEAFKILKDRETQTEEPDPFK